PLRFSPARSPDAAAFERRSPRPSVRSTKNSPTRSIASDRAGSHAPPCASGTAEQNSMSVASTDKGLLTPDNCAVILIDHQPQMFFGLANIDRQDLLNNVQVLAKAAKIFGAPVILTAIQSGVFNGNIMPQLLDLFPDQRPIERSSMNAWASDEFMVAIKRAGRKNLIMAALWSEVCLA